MHTMARVLFFRLHGLRNTSFFHTHIEFGIIIFISYLCIKNPLG